MARQSPSPPAERPAATPSEFRLVNPDSRYAPITLIEPTSLGYVLVAAQVHPRPLPFWPAGREKARLLVKLKALARHLEGLDSVTRATVFDALASPPVSRLPYIRERKDEIHLARFDVVVLIEIPSPAVAPSMQADPAYRALLDVLGTKARDMQVITARNAKRIGDVDRNQKGTFLFNFFVADDTRVALELWDYLAGWYAVETGLDNSILLVPLDGEHSNYLAVNHARWDQPLPVVMARQLIKRSFWRYVQANMEANRVGSMPSLYRRV